MNIVRLMSLDDDFGVLRRQAIVSRTKSAAAPLRNGPTGTQALREANLPALPCSVKFRALRHRPESGFIGGADSCVTKKIECAALYVRLFSPSSDPASRAGAQAAGNKAADTKIATAVSFDRRPRPAEQCVLRVFGRRTLTNKPRARPAGLTRDALLWGRRPLRELPNDEENPVNEKPVPSFICKGSRSSAPVFEIAGALLRTPDRAETRSTPSTRARRRTGAPPCQPRMCCLLPPQRSQDEIHTAFMSASRASDELPPDIRMEFSMARAFIVYDAGGQKGLKKHTDGRKEGATYYPDARRRL